MQAGRVNESPLFLVTSAMVPFPPFLSKVIVTGTGVGGVPVGLKVTTTVLFSFIVISKTLLITPVTVSFTFTSSISYPGSGANVNVTVSPAFFVSFVGLTLPCPPSTLAVNVYCVVGVDEAVTFILNVVVLS